MIPTSAVTSPLYRIVAEATLRRGAEYLLLLLIEIWLEHVKGLNRLPLMLMIRAPSNPTANVLHTPAQVPHFRSLLTSSGCPVTREFLPQFHTSILDHRISCKESDGEGQWVSERGVKATASKSDNIISTPARERPSLTFNKASS